MIVTMRARRSTADGSTVTRPSRASGLRFEAIVVRSMAIISARLVIVVSPTHSHQFPSTQIQVRKLTGTPAHVPDSQLWGTKLDVVK
ncbi:hypothetical protein [Streptomyces sp. NPDC052036]|uniref:hypothetical protein n=2 Tax=unclassified Streptomyces TaxID=2593676 RepID=UPI00343EC09D